MKPWIDQSRVRAALSSPRGDVLRLIVLQPYRGFESKHLVGPPVPVPERMA
jgi:hypothetical protein